MAPASAYQMLPAARLPLDPTTQVGIRREAKRSRISQPRKLDGVAGGTGKQVDVLFDTISAVLGAAVNSRRP